MAESLEQSHTPAVEVRFVYDPQAQKWEVQVYKARSDVEAKQCFNAIMMTMKDPRVIVCMDHIVESREDHYMIRPAVYEENHEEHQQEQKPS